MLLAYSLCTLSGISMKECWIFCTIYFLTSVSFRKTFWYGFCMISSCLSFNSLILFQYVKRLHFLTHLLSFHFRWQHFPTLISFLVLFYICLSLLIMFFLFYELYFFQYFWFIIKSHISRSLNVNYSVYWISRLYFQVRSFPVICVFVNSLKFICNSRVNQH